MATLKLTKDEFARLVGRCKENGICDKCVLNVLGCIFDEKDEFANLCNLVEIEADNGER